MSETATFECAWCLEANRTDREYNEKRGTMNHIPVTHHSDLFSDDVVAVAAREIIRAQGYGNVWLAETQREAEALAVAALESAHAAMNAKQFNPDWSLLRATQASLREQTKEIALLRERLRKALSASISITPCSDGVVEAVLSDNRGQIVQFLGLHRSDPEFETKMMEWVGKLISTIGGIGRCDNRANSFNSRNPGYYAKYKKKPNASSS